MRLLLASASPRRAELLAAAGFEFDVRPAHVDERIRDGERPADYVQRLASEKSAAVLGEIERGADRGHALGARRHALKGVPYVPTPHLIVIGADTTVVVDGEILGKPRDDRDARAMLERLAGRTHEVLTGVSVRCTDREARGVETTS